MYISMSSVMARVWHLDIWIPCSPQDPLHLDMTSTAIQLRLTYQDSCMKLLIDDVYNTGSKKE